MEEKSFSPAQQEAVAQASKNIYLEIDLRKFALDKAATHLYEGDAYEVTQAADVFLEFLQTGVAVTKPTSGVATNE